MPALAVVVVIAAVTATLRGRLRPAVVPDRVVLPWDLADAARRQITILSGQAAVSVTSLVLLVTLAHNQPGVEQGAFNTVVAMVLVAFVSFVGAAIQLVNTPIEGGVEGTLVPRMLYLAASFQHYRTLFLGWLALKPLVDTFGLHQPATVLSWILGSAALAGWLVVASVAYRSGVLHHLEAFIAPAVGAVVAIVAGFGLRQAGLIGHDGAAEAVLALTLGLFVLNVVAFTVNALGPIVAMDPRGTPWFARLAPAYALIDLQASVVILALIWTMLL